MTMKKLIKWTLNHVPRPLLQRIAGWAVPMAGENGTRLAAMARALRVRRIMDWAPVEGSRKDTPGRCRWASGPGMHRQPDGVGAGGRDPVALAGRDQQPVTWGEGLAL